MSELNDKDLSLIVAGIMGINAIGHTQVCQAFMASGLMAITNIALFMELQNDK